MILTSEQEWFDYLKEYCYKLSTEECKKCSIILVQESFLMGFVSLNCCQIVFKDILCPELIQHVSDALSSSTYKLMYIPGTGTPFLHIFSIKLYMQWVTKKIKSFCSDKSVIPIKIIT